MFSKPWKSRELTLHFRHTLHDLFHVNCLKKGKEIVLCISQIYKMYFCIWLGSSIYTQDTNFLREEKLQLIGSPVREVLQ